MSEKDGKSTNASGSMSSSLSDSWSVINKQGDLDDDSSSTTSSVEVVEEDDEDESQQTSLGTSPSLSTSTGPLFVLRLSSHDVSDTDDDDKTTSGVTETIADSRSFDILAEQNQVNAEGQNTDAFKSSSEEQVKDDAQIKTDIQDRNSPPRVEEHIESLVKAIDEVQCNFKQTSSVPSSVDASQDSLDALPASTDALTETEKEINTESVEMLVENIGSKCNTVDERMEESLNSNFSFLGIDKEPCQKMESPDTSESTISTIMNQSMERSEDAGNHHILDGTERGEQATDTETDEGLENMTEGRGQWIVEKCKQLYNFLKELFEMYTQLTSSGSLVVFTLVVSVVVCFTSSYTTYIVLGRQEHTSEHMESYTKMFERQHNVEANLRRCLGSEKRLKLELENKRRSRNCAFELTEANKIIDKWGNTHPDKVEFEIKEFLRGSKSLDGIEPAMMIHGTDKNHKLEMMEKKANTLALLVKIVTDENEELKQSYEKLLEKYKKMKGDLEKSEYTNAQNERKSNQEKNKGNANYQQKDYQEDINSKTNGGEHAKKEEFCDGEDEDNDNHKTGKEKVTLDECLQTLLKFYQQKIGETYNYHYESAFMDSSSVREYLFGYLEDIIPENLMLFLKRMNSDGTSKPRGSDDKQGTSEPTDDNQWSKNDGTQSGDSEGQGDDHHKFHEDQTKKTGSGYWADTVLEIMNRTRIDIQNTWEQVKNISEIKWQKHGPAITKLQNKFVDKFQQLGDKFQAKLSMKIKKWFYKDSEKEENKSKKKENSQDSFAKTKRREDATDDDKVHTNTGKPYICSGDVIDAQISIVYSNANEFKKMDDSRKFLKRLKNIRREENIPADSLVKTWLDCQIDWWSYNDARPFELPQFFIKDACFDSVECWQLEVSEGEHGVGQKRCHKLKRAFGNVIYKACNRVAHAYETDEDSEIINFYNKYEQTSEYDDTVSSPYHHGKENADDDDDDDDDGKDTLLDEVIELWLIYEHDEPDFWYFRRYKKLRAEVAQGL